MNNEYKEVRLNENCKLYLKTIRYQKDGQNKELTQLVLRAKWKDELGDNKVTEVNLTTKDNYKAIYAIRMNALNQ